MKASAALLLLLAGCNVTTAPESQSAPAHQLKVVSVTCSPNYGRPRADVAVTNTGATTIEYAKAVVSFGGKVADSYLSPRPLRPGGIATATVYSPTEGDSPNCSLVAVHDGDGYAATLSR